MTTTNPIIAAIIAITELDAATLPTPADFPDMTAFYARDYTSTRAEYDRIYRLAEPAFAALTDDQFRALTLELFECKSMRKFRRDFDNSDDYEFIIPTAIPESHHDYPIFNAYTDELELRLDENLI